jgi:hypothetical protein
MLRDLNTKTGWEDILSRIEGYLILKPRQEKEFPGFILLKTYNHSIISRSNKSHKINRLPVFYRNKLWTAQVWGKLSVT